MLQGLTDAAGSDVRISFTPHLMPMSRGMQSTIYVKTSKGATADDLRAHLQVTLTILLDCNTEAYSQKYIWYPELSKLQFNKLKLSVSAGCLLSGRTCL